MGTSVSVLMGTAEIAKPQTVWSSTPVAKRIRRVEQTEITVYTNRLFLGEIARQTMMSRRRAHLGYSAITFAWGTLFLLFATILSAATGRPYQAPLACCIAVLGVLVVLLMKLRDAKKET